MESKQNYDEISEENQAFLMKITSLIIFQARENFPKDVFLQITNEGHVKRVITANNFDQKKSLEQWDNWAKWINQYRPHEISIDQVLPELKTGKAFIHKQDRLKHPCLVIKTKNHVPNLSTPDSLTRLIIYQMEQAIKISETQSDGQCVLILDKEGSGFRNLALNVLGSCKDLATIFQSYYPERVFRVFFMYPNWFIKSLMQMLKMILPQRAMDRIVIVNDVKIMKQYFEDECILKEHGGNSDFKLENIADQSQQLNQFQQNQSEEEEQSLDDDTLKIINQQIQNNQQQKPQNSNQIENQDISPKILPKLQDTSSLMAQNQKNDAIKQNFQISKDEEISAIN